MLVNAFMPIIFEVQTIVLQWFAVARDSGMWCKCGKGSQERYYSTKQK